MAVQNQNSRRAFPDLLSKFHNEPLTDTHLRECVLRNLRSLFNEHRPSLCEGDTDLFPEARDSTANFCVRALGSEWGELSDYARHLASAIRVFESRLNPHTVNVRYVSMKSPKPRWIFRIDGDIWSERGECGFRCFVSFDLDGRATFLV